MLFDKLIGSKISQISRVCDLICISFISTGQTEISIHIQSFFRIIKKGKIILSSEDMYRCDPNFDYESFEWDVPGKSLYDSALKKHYNDLLNISVINCLKSDVGDLSIIFQDDIVFQIFINTVESEEKYRIFYDDVNVVVNS